MAALLCYIYHGGTKMIYVIVEDDKVVTTNVSREDFPMAIEAPDDTVFGDTIKKDGTFDKTGYRPAPMVVPPEQQREDVYLNREVIEWKGEMLTIDAATKRWLYYLSGDDTENANAIKALIVPARAAIKSEIPDAE
jgi:hypothetical protein